MTVDFSDYFWGEGQKNAGIDVLFQNAKYGITTTKEVADYLKERSSIEETHSKALGKLAKLTSNGCPNGSLAPMWQVLKNLSEKLSTAHSQMVLKIEELVKELLKYADELQKQYKTFKDGEAGTLESVQVFQNTRIMVGKTKAQYMKFLSEVEKCQKDNVPQKEMEKADLKMKKAQDEYKAWREKYQISTEDYIIHMTESCQRFQDAEVFYLEKMKELLDSYATIMENNHEILGQVQSEFRNECSTLTVDELLQQFVKMKATGSTRPVVGEGEDTISALEISQSGSSEDRSMTAVSGDKDKSLSITSLPLPQPPATLAPIAPPPLLVGTNEKIFEGNLVNDNHSTTSSIGDVRGATAAAASTSTKGSRRTTSLLNLFIPQSQGSKNKNIESPIEVGSNVDPAAPPNTNSPMPPPSTLSRSNNSRGSKWFLRSRRGKKKDKKNKENKNKDDSIGPKEGDSLSKSLNNTNSTKDQNQSLASEVSSPKVDAEGFTIRPKDVWEEEGKGNFYSSSDTDSDEEPEKRLHVEIKPLTNGTAPLSASVDELRTTVENLTLASVNRKVILDAEAQMKRSQSVSQQIGNTSPPSRHPYAPLSPSNNKLQTINASPSQNQNEVTPATASSSRYAELGDLFAEVGEMQPALPPKTSISRYTPTPSGSSNTMSIPRPPSRPRPEIPLTTNRTTTGSPSPAVSRTDSVTSLETKSIGGGSYFGGSRGPSPLTLGISDSIPIAVAFHEIVHAYFKGNDENQCKVKMTGDMMVSFPSGIIQIFANNPTPAQLSFQVRSKQPLENLICNKNLVNVETKDDILHFEFNMSALTILLKSQTEKNPSASYFNVDILKYQIKPKFGATSCPLHLVAFWKCELNQTDLRVDYKYNSHAMELPQSEVIKRASSPSPSASGAGGNTNPAQLLQVCIAAPVDGGVKTMQSKPSGQWFANTNRACWKLHTLSPKSDNQGVGSLRARFEVSNGPSSNGTIAAQFSCENSTLSGCEFQLQCSGYRVSLVKKRFVSGKYICDAEENSNRYAVPPDYSKPIHL